MLRFDVEILDVVIRLSVLIVRNGVQGSKTCIRSPNGATMAVLTGDIFESYIPQRDYHSGSKLSRDTLTRV